MSAIRQKISALLAKAESSEFEAEAEAFYAKAAELMAQYSIEEADLRAKKDSPLLTIDDVEVRRVTVPNPYSVERVRLLVAVATAMGCEAFYYKQTRDGTKTRLNIRNHDTLGAIVGLPGDIDIVEEMFKSISDQCERFRQIALNQESEYMYMSLGDKKVFSASFMRGYATRMAQRLKEAYDNQMTETSGSVALVLRNKNDVVKEKFKSMKLGGSVSKRKHNSRGAYLGADAANKTRIQREMK